MDQHDRGDRDNHDHRDHQATKQPNDRDDHDHQPRRINAHVTHPDLAFSSLGTIESESESDVDDSENNAHEREDYDFLESSAFDSELGFLEEQYSDENDDDDNYYEVMDEDDDDELELDELTYEELVALGEFIGVEERGLSYKEISSCLRPIASKMTSSSSVNESQSSGVDRCAICQIDYEEGDENLVALHCKHAYHSECITKWLHIKKSCPICSSEVSSSPSSSSTATINANKDLS